MNRNDEMERRFEPIEHALYRDLYAALPETVARRCGISWVEDVGTLRMTCEAADHPFLNRVVGIPGQGAALGGWLESIAEHYRGAGISRWMAQVVPSDLSREARCGTSLRSTCPTLPRHLSWPAS